MEKKIIIKRIINIRIQIESQRLSRKTSENQRKLKEITNKVS